MRGVRAKKHWRKCGRCGKAYKAQRSTSKFCGPGCRAAAWRGKLTISV